MLRLTHVSPDDPALRAHHLSVDGLSAEGPNLSHWPGNRTPQAWKADLSTGICLAFAGEPESERARWLDGADQVLNDHYDTDGFLSLLSVLRPEIALPRAELCLATAATGDFQVFVSDRAFAIDRIVLELGAASRDPRAGGLHALPGASSDFARYAWLLAHAETILDHPEHFAALYEADLVATKSALRAARGGALRRELHHDVGLSVLTSEADLPRMVLNTFSAAYRVLHVRPAPRGHLFRMHERVESWFEMVTVAPPARRDLRALAARLQELEPEEGAGGWHADPPDAPIPELYCGLPSRQRIGEVTRELTPSALAPETVLAELRRFWTATEA